MSGPACREARASTLPTSSRSMRANLAKFSSSTCISASKVCNRSQRRGTNPDLLLSDHAGHRILHKPVHVVGFLAAGHAVIDELPEQVGERGCVFLPHRE